MAQLNYQLPLAPSIMIADQRQMQRLAAAVEAQSAALLSDKLITDSATRRDLFAARRTAAMVRGDFAAAARFDQAATGAQQPSLSIDLLIAALQAEHSAPAAGRVAAARHAIRSRLHQRGGDQRDRVIALRRDLVLASSAFRLGEISSFADPEWQRDPVVQQEFAVALMRLWVEINLRNPRLDLFEAELVRWLARHPERGVALWRQREAPLDPLRANPVTLAVWDGVDRQVFGEQLQAELGDPPNGRDDDGDGFVDEAEGLAFDERFSPSSGLLMPVPEGLTRRLPDFERYKRGLGALAMGLDGPDVAFARALRRSLTPADVGEFERGYGFYVNYAHGTQVAGVALRGLPRARLVPVRITFSNETPTPILDEAAAQRFVAMVETATRYMRARGVRICNISWGFTAQDIDGSLKQHGAERNAVARARRARAIFATMQAGMTRAVAASPEILFVVSAGNASQNIDNAGDLPGTINLPNILTVGAADERGRVASFASTGASVDLYAPGTNIESMVPGGGRLRTSGASLAAPQVANTAARLLAVHPTLTASELATLLVQTATPIAGSDLPLLDERRAMELVRARSTAAR
jgi:Subtilase family